MDFCVKACGPDCSACHGAQCTRCMNGKYLTEQGSCVGECPPGWIEQGDSNEGRKCTLCQGKSDRRRTRSCQPCQAGFVSKTDSNDCQNLQETCTTEQCVSCKECLDAVTPQIRQCVKNEKCYNPG